MGPLHGIKIIELAGIGPAPFCAMLLADMGADVIRVDRPGGDNLLGIDYDVLLRGRRSIALDLKSADGVATMLKLIDSADGLIEGFRPGVMERLGLGPDTCLERNPKLVFGRMTGWGQEGPLSRAAGHDINYIALTGALHAIGTTAHGPVPPLNLLGDFGGGALYLAFGMVCGLLEARTSNKGQVIDAAMTDGSAHLMTMIYGLHQQGRWTDSRAGNLLDGGAPFYRAYQCADAKWIAIGSIEPQFYAQLMEVAQVDDDALGAQMDAVAWPALTEELTKVFKSKTRDQWCALMEGTDICFAPVLSLAEAPEHPHNVDRGTFVVRDGVLQPAPAPRFSRTKAEIRRPPPAPGEHTDEILNDWGITPPQRRENSTS
jgi:alpha-methylacyl-CoA racemase